jgi:hypothetical protein
MLLMAWYTQSCFENTCTTKTNREKAAAAAPAAAAVEQYENLVAR